MKAQKCKCMVDSTCRVLPVAFAALTYCGFCSAPVGENCVHDRLLGTQQLTKHNKTTEFYGGARMSSCRSRRLGVTTSLHKLVCA